MRELNLQKLAGAMASRFGVRIDVRDPAFALVLLNQLVLEVTVEELAGGIRAALHQCEESLRKTESDAGHRIGREFQERVAALRSELQKDITLAGARANELVFRVEQANRYPLMLRWATLGIVAALLLFRAGIWIGGRYVHF